MVVGSIAVHIVCTSLAASHRNFKDIRSTSLKSYDTAGFLHYKFCSRNKDLRTNHCLLRCLLLSGFSVLIKTGLSLSHKIHPCSESLSDPQETIKTCSRDLKT